VNAAFLSEAFVRENKDGVALKAGKHYDVEMDGGAATQECWTIVSNCPAKQ
jgi:hypothetical protein